MTEKDRLIRARLVILTLAAEIKNVARACKLAGVSRSQFYAMKKAYETHGKEALAPRVRRKPEMPNRTPAGLEERILLNTRAYPTFSYIRLAREMQSQGVGVSPTMIRYVWRRHGLSTRSVRQEWVNTFSGHVGDVTAGFSQNGYIKVDPSAPVSCKSSGSLKSAKGRKSFTGNDPGVDWTYWSQRVHESLAR
jgi:Helix-turn-helix domain